MFAGGSVDFFGRFELDPLNLAGGLHGSSERGLPVGAHVGQFLLERFQIGANDFLLVKEFFSIGRERDFFSLPELDFLFGLLLSRLRMRRKLSWVVAIALANNARSIEFWWKKYS